MNHPTPYPEVNRFASELLARIQAVLGSRLVGLYLEGSLANGGFDAGSDIDFVAVTETEVTEDEFLRLQAAHDDLAALDSPYAHELEGSYLSRRAVRRYDPALTVFPNIERGPGERLKIVDYGEAWVTHRWILRERGITLYGPPPAALVDPVSPADLRHSMQSLKGEWLAPLLADSSKIATQGYQSYIVLTLCRVFYTLDTGAVASKQAAAAWAMEHLDPRWAPLIERALAGRISPAQPPAGDDLAATLQMIHEAIERTAPGKSV